MRNYLLCLLLAATACSVQQQNGNPISLERPFALDDQPWIITDQSTPQNDRVCTIAAGEMQVTQRLHNNAISAQVATSVRLNVGESYKILVGEHVYETPQSIFDARQSRAIITDLLASDSVYTEMRKISLTEGHAGPNLRKIDNRISLDGFADLYRRCGRFLTNNAGI